MSRKYLNRSEAQGCWARGHLCSRVAGGIFLLLSLFSDVPVLAACLWEVFRCAWWFSFALVCLTLSQPTRPVCLLLFSLPAKCHRRPPIILEVRAEASELWPRFLPVSELHGRQESGCDSPGLFLWVFTVLGLWP